MVDFWQRYTLIAVVREALGSWSLLHALRGVLRHTRRVAYTMFFHHIIYVLFGNVAS